MSDLRRRIERVMRGLEPPGLLYAPLSAISLLYSFGVRARNVAFDIGAITPVRIPVKVISVGNLTVGGSGKTPFVELVVKKLAPRRAGVLSRGYGGQSGEPIHVVSDGSTLALPPPVSADEPYMLARRLTGVPVVCAPERERGAVFMSEKFNLDAIILDDGFQRRKLARDLDILLIGEDFPFGSARLIPMGTLREPVHQARRADIIVITGAEKADSGHVSKLKREIARVAGVAKPVAVAGGRLTGFFKLDGSRVEAVEGRALLFCGIANPERFMESVRSVGVDATKILAFPDHRQFTAWDMERVCAEARKVGATTLVTTEKDAMRLFNIVINPEWPPIVYAGYEAFLKEGESLLDSALENLFRSG